MKSKGLLSKEISQRQIANNKIESSIGKFYRNAGMSIEQCKPGGPDFLKFLAKTNAILNSAGEEKEQKGFCFNSLKYSYTMLSETSLQIKITASDATSWFCSDVHLYSVGTNWSWGNVFFRGDRYIQFNDLSQLD